MLVSANDKLTNFNDMQEDIARHKEMVNESEDAREELQVNIVQISKQIQEDTDLKEKYQTSLL